MDPFSKDKVMKIETMAASKKTAESLKYGEDLMEALQLAEDFKTEIEQYEMELEEFDKSFGKSARPTKPRPSPMFNNRSIFEHVLMHLKAIRNAELENALRFLNYKQSVKLLYYLEHLIRNNLEMELAARAVQFILETYQPQIQMSIDMEPLLKSISVHMRYHYKEKKDMIGMNVSALKLLEKETQ